MAENVRETPPPEPPPKPPEVPKPTEQPNGSEAKDHGQPHESRQSAQQDARNAAQSEHAKATGPDPDGLRPTPEFQARLDEHSAAKNGAEGLQPTPEFQERLDAHTAAKAERNAAPRSEDSGGRQPPQESQPMDDSQAVQRSQDAVATARDRNEAVPAGEQAGEHAAARQAAAGETPDGAKLPDETPNDYAGPDRRQHEPQHFDPAADLRDQPQTPPEDNTGTDVSPETTARLDELRTQGHGPQRHHDPTVEQLGARLGDPILDPQTGDPVVKDNGHVQAENRIDPMTGTTVDGVHGGVHRCGDYATRFDSPEDYVAADRYMRDQIGDTGPATARRPISEVLDPDAHERMTGYYHDPDAAGQLRPVDFTGGTVFAMYDRLPDGDLNLRTMYVDPAPFYLSQKGGTD